MQAQALAQLDQLRASRVRIVETGDTERRRLERDLHDGAQQRLLALSYDIRLARANAEADGDAQTGTLLTEATDQAQAALRILGVGLTVGRADAAQPTSDQTDTRAIGSCFAGSRRRSGHPGAGSEDAS